jgi:hypothetical protein
MRDLVALETRAWARMYGLILKFRREAAAVRPLLGQEDEDRCAAVLSAMEEFLAHRPKRDGTTIVHVHED